MIGRYAAVPSTCEPPFRTPAVWDADTVRALRFSLGLTQVEMSQLLGMRQQTISEWELGKHRPRGASIAMLKRVADEAGFDPAARHIISPTRMSRARAQE
jgi:transcriptional regulator with XRE-family HTH domain